MFGNICINILLQETSATPLLHFCKHSAAEMLVALREDLSESSFQKKLFIQFKKQTILLTGDILFSEEVYL